jgi:hypothetical protein
VSGSDGATLVVNGVEVNNLNVSPFYGSAVAAQPPRRLQLSLRMRF